MISHRLAVVMGLCILGVESALLHNLSYKNAGDSFDIKANSVPDSSSQFSLWVTSSSVRKPLTPVAPESET